MGHAEDGDADAEPKLLGECEDGTEAPISAPAGESFQLKKIFFLPLFLHYGHWMQLEGSEAACESNSSP